nr:hypothetical protein [Anaerolineae bacterium]
MKTLFTLSIRYYWLFAGMLLAGAILTTASLSSAQASSGLPDNRQATSTPGGQVQLPTATQTEVGAPTPTPTPTATLSPVMAEVVGNPTNLRSLPTIGDDYIIDTVEPGLMLPVIGRWLGFDWLLIAWDDAPDGQAWVYQPLVIVQGDITTIPAVEPPPAPTVNPTYAALQLTATILVQTPGAVEAATGTAIFASAGGTPSGNGAIPGTLPTFTPPPPYIQPEELPVPTMSGNGNTGIPPAVFIVSLTAMGILMLLLGLIRRIF